MCHSVGDGSRIYLPFVVRVVVWIILVLWKSAIVSGRWLALVEARLLSPAVRG